MFKVSFKKNGSIPPKKVWRNNKTRETFVVMYGKVQLSLFLQQYFILPEIKNWMDSCQNVQVELGMTTVYLTIKGKAKRMENDTDDPVLGERIAECRAKINLYWFMQTLTSKLYIYYCRLLSTSTFTNAYAGEDTIAGANIKYANLLSRETAHLKSLLAHESYTESSQKH